MKRKFMKVSFLVGTLGRGGAERQLLYMLRAARAAQIETRVLCLTRGESYETEIASLGTPILWVGRPQSRVGRLYEIVRALRKNPPDILQSSHFFTNIYAGLAGKYLKIPSIGAVRSNLFSEIKMHGFYGRWQISLPRFLIMNSDAARQTAIERGISPQKVAFVRNVVETGGGAAAASEKDEQTTTLLFVGRLDQMKRPASFVRLAHILTTKYPQRRLRFLVAGDGELKKQTEELARALSLPPDKMTFLGIRADMDEIYRRADVLVSTSAREGTSNVILEAQAHGLPVIATRVGGTPEILNERRGVLVPLDNEKALVAAAEKLIFDRSLRRRLGAEGQRYVSKHHSLAYLTRRLSGIYAQLSNY